MGKKVLVVDDSATARQQVRMVLEHAGFDVVEAVDGLEALSKMGANLCDGVICDLNMPKMSGIEFVEAVKKDAKIESIPILILSTERNPEVLRRAQAAGVKGWMIKPFQGAKVVDTMTRLIGN